jgi:hypothetical protein
MKVLFQEIYTGDDAAKHFVETLINLRPQIKDYIKSCMDMSFTEADQVIVLQKKRNLTIVAITMKVKLR